jgi:hypothetical protein
MKDWAAGGGQDLHPQKTNGTRLADKSDRKANERATGTLLIQFCIAINPCRFLSLFCPVEEAAAFLNYFFTLPMVAAGFGCGGQSE